MPELIVVKRADVQPAFQAGERYAFRARRLVIVVDQVIRGAAEGDDLVYFGPAHGRYQVRCAAAELRAILERWGAVRLSKK